MLALLTTINTASASLTHGNLCYADAYGVHKSHPGSWAGWTRHMNGHAGEKCYYPTTKPKRQVLRHKIRIYIKADNSSEFQCNAKCQNARDSMYREFIEFLEWRRQEILKGLYK